MKPIPLPSLLRCTILALTSVAATVSAAEDPHDIVIYGGNSGGIVAAVQATRSGHSVILISPTEKLGGLSMVFFLDPFKWSLKPIVLVRHCRRKRRG